MLSNIKLFLVSIVFAFMYSQGFAGVISGKLENSNAEYKAFEVSPKLVLEQYKYTEDAMTTKGPLFGVEVNTFYRPKESAVFYGLTSSYKTGDHKYDGQISNAQTNESKPFQEDDKTYIFTNHITVGKSFDLNDYDQYVFTLQGGLAHRYLNNQGNSIYSYEREQTYWYAPVIVELSRPLSDTLTIKAGIELDLFISGKNITHPSISNADSGNMEFNQKSGGGSKLQFSLAHEIQNLTMLYQLYHESWDINASTSVDTGETDINGERIYYVEPENETSVTGLSIGAIF